MGKFDAIKVGDRAEISHTISASDIEQFVNLTGDDNKLHTDLQFAGRTSMQKPVAHGMLSASFISTIIGTKLPGDGALWFSQTLEFVAPVRVGDTIKVSAVVTSKDERTSVIELHTDIVNQNKQTVIRGSAKVRVIEQVVTPEVGPPTPSRVALVLGASGGIGYAVAEELLGAGFKVALHYNRNKERLQTLLGSANGTENHKLMVQADLLKEGEVAAMASGVERRLGAVSVVVNCATVSLARMKFDKLEWSDIAHQFDAAVRANFTVVNAFLPGMKAQKYGKFVFISSQAADGVPPSEMLHYVTAKSALNGFAKALAVELAPANITVNIVSPGMTDTPLNVGVSEKSRLLVAARTPLKRLASPHDVAKAIRYLAADAEYLTGETIRVNGGAAMT